MTDQAEDIRARVDLTAVVIAMRDGTPCVLTVQAPLPAPTSARMAVAESSVAENSAAELATEAAAPSFSPISLPAGPLQPGHRSLQGGLRSWVERQTGCQLGYVEQLYTFADRPGGARESEPETRNRAISIAYLALVSIAKENLPIEERWRPWYGFFPWEDMRFGEPPARTAVLDRLWDWASEAGRARARDCLGRMLLTFGLNGFPWDEERALERYEMLYEAGLVAEAWWDRGMKPPADVTGGPGIPMVADHRRILATAISRLRAKIKYRPVLFELMPPTFTLSELQKTAEALCGIALHKQNFRRLIAQQRLVEETGEIATATGGRPAKLMRFRSEVTLERPAPGVRLSATRRAAYP